jgi:DNA-directed RNA polymerase subunit RPC12/RpoP
MNRSELLQMCKEMGIKGVSSKPKNEILLIINEKKQENIGNISIPIKTDVESKIPVVILQELIMKTPKDKSRKVCKNCNELGHSITSVVCKINIDKNNKLKQKIKNYILSQNCLEDKTTDDYCIELSELLNITPNLCKSLYNEIPLEDFLDRPINLTLYLQKMNELSKKCNECNKNIVCIQTNTNRIWNGSDICDTCWSKYEDYRNRLWELIKEYKPIKCEICSSIQTSTSERYHYDHLNMFNKSKSVCSMVNEGVSIEEIYNEIDKCQILCLPCHHIVTDIEHKLGFTRIKQALTRNLNNGEITEEEYGCQTLYYQNIYDVKIKNMYTELKMLLG